MAQKDNVADVHRFSLDLGVLLVWISFRANRSALVFVFPKYLDGVSRRHPFDGVPFVLEDDREVPLAVHVDLCLLVVCTALVLVD